MPCSQFAYTGPVDVNFRIVLTNSVTILYIHTNDGSVEALPDDKLTAMSFS